MNLSIVITSYNRKDKLDRLIDSIYNSTMNMVFELIIVDDCSTDGTQKHIKQKYNKKSNFEFIEKKENSKKSSSVNMGIKASKGSSILLIDDDTVVESDTIQKLYEALEKIEKPCIIGPKIIDFHNRSKIWFDGLKIYYWTTLGEFRKKSEVTDVLPNEEVYESDGIVTCFMFKRELVDKIGLFNEKLFPFQFEELDFCNRAKIYGYNLYIIASSILLHDHKSAAFIKSPWRLYYEVRNRIITAKLWSKNKLQSFVATIFSLLIPIVYIPIIIFIAPGKTIDCLKSIISGIFDGLKLTLDIVPYNRRKSEDYSNW